MPSLAADAYWDADALTQTTDPREIRRDLENGTVDPIAVLALLDLYEDTIAELQEALDASEDAS